MIAGIIMASGFSRRMNRNKLLLKLGEETIIERVIKTASSSMLDEVIVVCNNSEIKKLAEKYKIKTVFNEAPDKGQSESMKIGIKKASTGVKGYMFIVGDQPFLDSSTINMLIDRFNEGNCSIVVPLYNGKRGNPTIFSSEHREALLAVEGDRGGRRIIDEYIEQVAFISISNYMLGLDIDTWEEYQQIKNGDVTID